MGWKITNIKNWASFCFVFTTVGEFAKKFGYENKSKRELYLMLRHDPTWEFFDEVIAHRSIVGDMSETDTCNDLGIQSRHIDNDTKIQRMKMITSWLVYTGLPECGIERITNKTCEDLYKRIWIYQNMFPNDRCKVYGSWAVYDTETKKLANKTEYKDLTLKDIRDHIGLVCNHGNRMSTAGFWKSVREKYDRWAEHSFESQKEGE